MRRATRSTLLISVLLISLVPGESKSSLNRTFFRFSAFDRFKDKSQIPPSQSPSPSTGLYQAPSSLPEAELFAIVTEERCNISLTVSCRDLNGMIACLSIGGTGPEGSYLIVQNDKDTPVSVNLTILPSNITFKEIELQKHQAKKIDISEIIGGSQSILLNAGNGNCTIHIASPAPEDNSENHFQWVVTNLNPTHGAYILVLMVLTGGGVWACIELRKKGRHVDGVPYQEIEMGQPEVVANVETRGGWNEDWDDDWDEEKAVKSRGRKPLRQGKANGNSVASGSSHVDG